MQHASTILANRIENSDNRTHQKRLTLSHRRVGYLFCGSHVRTLYKNHIDLKPCQPQRQLHANYLRSLKGSGKDGSRRAHRRTPAQWEPVLPREGGVVGFRFWGLPVVSRYCISFLLENIPKGNCNGDYS